MKGSFEDRWEWCLNCDEDLMPEWEYCPSCGQKLHELIETELEKLERKLDRFEKELVEIEKHESAINIQKRNAKSAISKVKVKIMNLKDKV